jgi:ankyrin repeat protein
MSQNYELINTCIESVDVVKKLLNDIKSNALIRACEYNQTAIAKILIEEQIDVNYKNAGGTSAIFYTIHANNIELLEILINAGADVNNNIIESEKLSPLMYACVRNNIDIVKMLIDAGANINFNNSKMNILTYAMVHKADINYSNKVINVLIVACGLERDDIVELLINLGVNIYKTPTNGTTPLLMAGYKKNIKIVKILIDQYKKNFNIINCDMEIETMEKLNHLEIAEILYDYKNNYNIKKICIYCRKSSTTNILAYIPLQCPICYEHNDTIVIFGCGHANCCKKCFIEME